ncbi:MAG: hypothetical protein EBE86_009245 [Hormoscilla sp. GUM202]|nr:hypothetical protein [Hormoscilla sp. GUM202]
MQQGFFYDFSNYGSYARLTDDGLTQWHLCFLELGLTLDGCAEKYKAFVAGINSGLSPIAVPIGAAISCQRFSNLSLSKNQ